MTTSNAITIDHINSFFSLSEEIEHLDIAPTATGGAGIDNRSQYPAPQPKAYGWKKAGTDYVKNYVNKNDEDEQVFCPKPEIAKCSMMSLNSLEDVEGVSTLIDAAPAVNELQAETTQQIYATYFNERRTYDPELTITRYREEILQQLEINPVVIIQGPTGCGKTTQVPQYILDHHQSRGIYCNIVVTQPRKIAAMSIARRVCHERNWQLGTIVGYQVAMDARVSTDTCISYVTTGVLLEKLVNAKRMDMYTHIIIDEVHERDQEIDFALLIVKKFLTSNSPRVKVILMSATFDSSSFAEYFNLRKKCGPAPIIDIIGKSKDVTEHYLLELGSLIKKMPEFDMEDPRIDPVLYDTVYALMCIFDRIEKSEQGVPEGQPYAPKRGAVLIFLPGYEEISALTNRLTGASFDKNFWIIPLHSSITVEEQTKVFQVAPPDHRKVIISTNIAESSITVPDVKYVIDFCLTKSLVTDPVTNYTCLQLEWASKANCIQRKGRAGRVDIGKVYRMVPRQFYNEFPEYSIPEIKRCPLTQTILRVKKLNLCEPQELLAFAIDPPDLSDIGYAVLQLKEALALTSRSRNPFDGELTFVGRVMANLPLDIKLSKLIIFGYVFHCLEECIIIAASLSLQSFFAKPFQAALDVYRSRLAWDDNAFSDCLVYLNAYRMWKRLSQQGQFKRPGGVAEYEWLRSHYIQIRRIKEVDLLVKELKSRLEKQQIVSDGHQPHKEDDKSILILKMVIAGAFFPHYYLQELLDEKTVMRDLHENDPFSTVCVSGLPPKQGILYAAALKEMFSCCSNSIQIEFEETKAYIKFGRNPDTPANSVLQPVYLAVKMRKLRMPLELSVFSAEEAERKLEQILSSKNTNKDNKFRSNRITVKAAQQFELKKIPMPPPDRLTIKIFITYIKNCSSFWGRELTPEASNNLRFIEMTINAGEGKNLLPLRGLPSVNMLCLAPYAEGRGPKAYYRAQVQNVSQNTAEVFFVDYGNVEKVNISDLRQIDENTPDVLTTPALAIECSLSEIKPFRSPSGDWSNKANAWLKSKVNGMQLDAKIYSVVNDTIRLELLYKDSHGRVRSINKQMIEEGLAEKAEETFASKQNHELRMKAASYSFDESTIKSVTNDVEVSWQEAVECNRLNKTGRKIRLHGPSNPLEVSYNGLTNMDRSKSVKVERDSVNSVSFNSEPQDACPSMLVAASVGISQSNQDVMVRNTTLMPKMCGLPTLVCLLFTPFAEIRTDKKRTSYTGALCGLGFDPATGEPIYPDHDIELVFDVHMSLDDIREINAIRMGFNLLLHSPNDMLQFQSAHAQSIHEKTRKAILKLLQKRWKPKEPEDFRNPCQWNQIPIDFILDTEVEERADHPDVFPLHKPPALAERAICGDAMMDHLSELYAIVDRSDLSTKLRIIRCKLCSLDLHSERDLLCHLNTDKHQWNEDQYKRKRNLF